MADTIEALILSISADTAQIKRALKGLDADIKSFAKGANDSLGAIKPPSADPLKSMSTNFGKSTTAMAHDARNLQFQLNDIATGLASGQSPFMVLSQQSGQLSQILSAQGGGIAQSAKFIGSAFMGMLNPINLAIVALGVATYAISSYFDEDEKAAKKAQKALDDEVAALDRVLEKWGELLPTLKAVREAQKAAAEQQDIKDVTQKQVQVNFADTKEVVDTLISSVVDLETQLNQFDDGEMAANIRKNFDELVKKVDAGTATLDDLNRLIRLINATPLDSTATRDFLTTLEKLRPELAAAAAETKKNIDEADAALAKSADDARQAALGVAIGVKDIAKAFIDTYNEAAKIPGILDEIGRRAIAAVNVVKTINEQSVGGLTPGIAYLPPLGSFNGQIMPASQSQAQMDSIRTDAAAAKAYLNTIKIGAANVAGFTDDFAVRLATLLLDFPDLGVISGQRSRELQAELYANRKPGQMVAPPGQSWHEPGIAADLAYKGQQVVPPFMDAVLKRAAELGLKSLGAGDEMHFELIDKGTLAIKKNTAAKKENSLADAMRNRQEDVNALNAEAEAFGYLGGKIDEATYKKVYAVEKSRLMDVAARDGTAATQAEAAAIDALAKKYATAEAAQEQYKIATKAATDADREKTESMKALAGQFDSMASSGISQFIIDMKNGVSAGEAFRNMLNTIIDQLIRMAIQAAITQSGFGAAMSSAFSFLAPVAAGGGVVGQIGNRQRVSPLAFAGARSYAAGGFVGMSPGAVPVIAHRGELIVPLSTMKRAASQRARGGGGGGGNVNIGNVTTNVDPSGHGVVASTHDGKALGDQINRAVQMVLVNESRPGGILRRVNG